MIEIQTTTVEVKVSDGHENSHVLVHDGSKVIVFATPNSGRVGTHKSKTMLTGSKEELEAEITRLNLEPLPDEEKGSNK